MATADPPEKRWYKRVSDGQLGWMVEVNGKDVIRLDRGKSEELVPYRDSIWQPVDSDRPVTRQQVARIAFDADRQLCRQLALHGEARIEWASLTDKARISFVKDGPPADPPMRRKFYEHIMAFFPKQV